MNRYKGITSIIYIMSETPEIKYSSYTAAQKKASQLYRQKNKEKINEQRKKYYQTKKSNDPTFLEYKRIKAKEYYEKKKLDKVVKSEAMPEESKIEVVDTAGLLKILIPDSPLVTAMEMSMPDIVKEAVLAPLPEDVETKPDEHVKRKRSSKSKK
jgi:hypothetical protein